MMFECARGVEQSLQWKRTGNRFEEPQTPDRRSGATAEARFCGYSALNLYMQRREGPATLTGKKAKRAFDIVLSVEFAIYETKFQCILTGYDSDRQPHIELN